MVDLIAIGILLAYAGIGIGFAALLFWHQDNYTHTSGKL